MKKQRKRCLLVNPAAAVGIYSGTRLEAALPRWPSPTLATLAATVRASGNEVRALDLTISSDALCEFDRALESFRPTHVGISATTATFNQAAQLADRARKQQTGATLIVGGPHSSALPEECLRNSAFDIAVIGEGDFTLPELLEAEERDLENIKGIAYKTRTGKVEITAHRKKIMDVDSLPLPAWDLFRATDYDCPPPTALQTPAAGIMTGRGCIFNCVFCDKSIFGRGYRPRSIDLIMQEIELLLDLGYREIHFLDDVFTADVERATAIAVELGELHSRYGRITWNVLAGLHASRADRHFLETAAQTGCHSVYVGFESANQANLDRLNKGATVDQISEACAQVRATGMSLVIGAIFGIPGETESSMRETIDMAIALKPSFAKVSILTPYPGTPLFNSLENEGRILNRDWSRYGFQKTFPADDPIWRHDTLEWSVILDYYQRFYREFYLRPGYVASIAISAVRRRQLLRYAEVGIRTFMPAPLRNMLHRLSNR
jgi:radical SAM superfamily enzyme YgiQ (UPF0313 family)